MWQSEHAASCIVGGEGSTMSPGGKGRQLRVLVRKDPHVGWASEEGCRGRGERREGLIQMGGKVFSAPAAWRGTATRGVTV